MLSNILDNLMYEEMFHGPSWSYESHNPIEESVLKICKSTRKDVQNNLMRLRIICFWYLLQNWMNLIM